MRTVEQMILGTLLGDGSMSYSGGKNPRYRVNHSSKQEAYVLVKYSVLQHLVRTPPRIYTNHGHGKFSARFETLSSPFLKEYHDLCYSNGGKKLVTKEWLDRLTPEGIAYWYMDDGGLCANLMKISTNSFSVPEQELLVNKLQEYGITPSIVPSKGKYHILVFNSENRDKFVDLIKPYIIPEMLYKIDVPIVNKDCEVCGTPFTSNQINKLTCSIECGYEMKVKKISARRKRNRELEKK
mgnify:CR=1 FL=1